MMVAIPDGLGGRIVCRERAYDADCTCRRGRARSNIVDTADAPVVIPVQTYRHCAEEGRSASSSEAVCLLDSMESRKIERCRTIYCGNNACSRMLDRLREGGQVLESYVWPPICVLFNPFLYVNLCICFCSDGAGSR